MNASAMTHDCAHRCIQQDHTSPVKRGVSGQRRKSHSYALGATKVGKHSSNIETTFSLGSNWNTSPQRFAQTRPPTTIFGGLGTSLWGGHCAIRKGYTVSQAPYMHTI